MEEEPKETPEPEKSARNNYAIYIIIAVAALYVGGKLFLHFTQGE